MPIFFRWYRHSFLASVVSIFGTASLAVGIGTAVQGAIGPGIAVAVIGALLMWLASKIADRKANKIAAKNNANLQPTPPAPPVQKTLPPNPGGNTGNAAPKAPSVQRKTPPTPGTNAGSSSGSDSVPRNLTRDQAIQAATKYASAGDTNKQISVLKKASEDYPNDVEVLNLLGQAYQKAGRYQDAFLCYRKAANLEPENGVIHGNYAVALMMSGDHEAALTRYERALPLLKKENNPQYAFYLASYAYSLAKCGYTENAARCLNDAEKAGYANVGKIRSKLQQSGIVLPT